MLGLLAALGAGLSLILFLRSGDEPSRVHWLAWAILSALVFVVWMLVL
ncbi:MAG TPA: hypothetical protein VHI54_02610 [Actinomycetota bacterium]|nr:hypothetical protein [Actinomycetota bacterium]